MLPSAVGVFKHYHYVKGTANRSWDVGVCFHGDTFDEWGLLAVKYTATVMFDGAVGVSASPAASSGEGRRVC